jgi:hypothetical protein
MGIKLKKKVMVMKMMMMVADRGVLQLNFVIQITIVYIQNFNSSRNMYREMHVKNLQWIWLVSNLIHSAWKVSTFTLGLHFCPMPPGSLERSTANVTENSLEILGVSCLLWRPPGLCLESIDIV